MHDYWILTKLQLYALYGVNKMRHSHSDEQRKQAKRSLLGLVAMVLGLGYFSAFYSIMLAQGLEAVGRLDGLLSIMAFAASALLLLFSVFEVKGVLFQFQDFDIVMSWPVRVGAVAASRVTMMYVYNLVYALLLLLPAGIIYGARTGQGGLYYLLLLLLSPFVPALPTLAGALIGTLVTMLTARMRKKSVFSAAFQMLFIFAVMALSMRLNTGMTALADNPALVSSLADNAYPPVQWFIRAITGEKGGVIGALLLIASAIAALAAFAWLLGKGYLALHSVLNASPGARHMGRVQAQRRSSLVRALYRLEWKRYISSSLYLTNTIFGYVLLLALAVLVGIIRPKAVVDALLSSDLERVRTAMPFLISWMVMMGATTASAISMEGKRLWIVKALPVPAKEWLFSKLLVSLTPAVPTLIVCAALLSIGLHANAAGLVWLLVTPVSYAILAGVLGLWLNLLLPKLDWKNDAEVVKQSAAVMIQVFASMALVALPSIALIITNASWILPLGTSLALLISGLVWIHLTRVADKRLLEL